MKRAISMVIGLALAIGLGLSARAQESSQKITITRDSRLGGEAVSKGEYLLRFTEGKADELVLLKGKREVISATYKVTKLAQPAADNAVIFTANADGSYQLKRIELKGRDTALVFEDTIAKSITK
jgi:hypothetical protein